MVGGPSGGSKEQAEALVKRENEARAKREGAAYEGLPDGLVLGKKMGDGAFSNVFQATLRPNAAQLAIDPTLGKSVKVAVKCVRKYELNHSQVSSVLLGHQPTHLLFLPPVRCRRWARGGMRRSRRGDDLTLASSPSRAAQPGPRREPPPSAVRTRLSCRALSSDAQAV